jgi:two-component system, cell cycle sensor histidine kinase and response regulator CckA
MTSDAKDERIRALEEEVRRLTVMLESAPDFITRITVDGDFLYLNRLAPGFEMKDVIGTSVDNYVPPEFRERARAAMRAAGETGKVQQYSTLGQVSADKIGHYLTRVSPIVENDAVTSLVMIATDVTALEESRTLLQVALNATGLGIWTYEPGSGFGSWDDTTRRIFGAEATEDSPHLSSMLQERVHPEDRELVAAGLRDVMSTGHYGPIEHRILLPNGELRWVAASGVAQSGPSGDVVRVVGSVMEITHRRALEARLLEAQKLESIGRLAGGVAHDFNNMLTAILGNVDFASRVRSLDEIRPLLDEIRVTAERSAALTAQLLAFARRQVIEPKVLDPNQLLKRLEPLLRRLLDERTTLTLRLEGRAHVRVDASQLEQVVLNLITNARDSLSQGGRVLLQTSDVTFEQNDPRRHPELAAGRYLAIIVTDNGSGIPPDALPQIFEPFFTTRRGGTGLGLATCYGIVKQSGGHIAVQNEPAGGASFSVFLPRVSATEPSPSEPAPVATNQAGGERVLLVEDEAVVRNIVARTLTRAGYRVAVATHGEEALQIAEREGPFDALVTDVVMPGMGGWELGKRLAERWPGLPVLYISGYTEDVMKAGGVVGEGLPFLQKPFLPADLLLALRKLLELKAR